jgi:hypothetical protein
MATIPAPTPPDYGSTKHDTRPTKFTLVVDDFGVKYQSQEDADHLVATLEKYYKVSTDWTGSRYVGFTLAWDYEARTCDTSMPGYIERMLLRFQHQEPANPHHSPHKWIAPKYGSKTQYAD